MADADDDRRANAWAVGYRLRPSFFDSADTKLKASAALVALPVAAMSV
jgi:hypothetical protein